MLSSCRVHKELAVPTAEISSAEVTKTSFWSQFSLVHLHFNPQQFSLSHVTFSLPVFLQNLFVKCLNTSSCTRTPENTL